MRATGGRGVAKTPGLRAEGESGGTHREVRALSPNRTDRVKGHASAGSLGADACRRRRFNPTTLPTMPDRKPRLVAFDLDGTLWAPEMYQLWGGGSPFRASPCGQHLIDSAGKRLSLLGPTRSLLVELSTSPEWSGVELAYVSTCDEPEWARECLPMFALGGGLTMLTAAGHHEIYKAESKQTHFAALARRTGIAFSDMLFFDNQTDNCEHVSALGVHCVYAPGGMTQHVWQAGLSGWRSR